MRTTNDDSLIAEFLLTPRDVNVRLPERLGRADGNVEEGSDEVRASLRTALGNIACTPFLAFHQAVLAEELARLVT